MSNGFREEISPKSKLGKQLAQLSIYLRNTAPGVGPVTKRKVWLAGVDTGFVEGQWTVRKSGAISFKGQSEWYGTIEYLYGKLTIASTPDLSGKSITLPAVEAAKLLSKYIEIWYPRLGRTPLSLDIKVNC